MPNPGLQFLAYICIGSLFALTGLRQFFISPLSDPATNFVWFIVQVSPLLLLLPGFIRGRLRSSFLLCMAALLYFIHGVMVSFETGMLWLGLAEIGFSLALTTTLAYIVRQLREAGAESQMD